MVQNGNLVAVHYVGTFENGEVFDTSEGKDPISFEVGAGQVIPGFENAVLGLEKGETKNVVISPEDGYGEVSEAFIINVPKEQVPPTVKVGDTLQGAQEGALHNFTVSEVNDTQVVLDGNHPLAGKTLRFAVTVFDIQN